MITNFFLFKCPHAAVHGKIVLGSYKINQELNKYINHLIVLEIINAISYILL
jgi:hypothetical protein